jgi:hypothetical protein
MHALAEIPSISFIGLRGVKQVIREIIGGFGRISWHQGEVRIA